MNLPHASTQLNLMDFIEYMVKHNDRDHLDKFEKRQLDDLVQITMQLDKIKILYGLNINAFVIPFDRCQPERFHGTSVVELIQPLIDRFRSHRGDPSDEKRSD